MAAANAAIDNHREDFLERTGKLRLTNGGTPMAGDGATGRADLGGKIKDTWISPVFTPCAKFVVINTKSVVYI